VAECGTSPQSNLPTDVRAVTKGWVLMRHVLMALVLVICLLGAIGLSGCLFGKKGGDEATESEETPVVSASGPDEAPGPGVGPAETEGPAAGPKLPLAPPSAEQPAAGDPAEAKSLIAQAKQAKASGNYDDALALAKKAAGAAPGNADPHWIMAWIYAEREQKPQAAGEFNAFIAGAGNDPRVSDAKAALERLGQAPAGGPPAGLKPPGPTPGG